MLIIAVPNMFSIFRLTMHTRRVQWMDSHLSQWRKRNSLFEITINNVYSNLTTKGSKTRNANKCQTHFKSLFRLPSWSHQTKKKTRNRIGTISVSKPTREHICAHVTRWTGKAPLTRFCSLFFLCLILKKH